MFCIQNNMHDTPLPKWYDLQQKTVSRDTSAPVLWQLVLCLGKFIHSSVQAGPMLMLPPQEALRSPLTRSPSAIASDIAQTNFISTTSSLSYSHKLIFSLEKLPVQVSFFNFIFLANPYIKVFVKDGGLGYLCVIDNISGNNTVIYMKFVLEYKYSFSERYIWVSCTFVIKGKWSVVLKIYVFC